MLSRLLLYLLISLPVLLGRGASAGGSPEKSPVAPTAPPSRPPPTLGDPSWTLGLRLYRALRSDPGSINTLFSPLLVASSLGALGGGAAGATAIQLRELLQTPSEADASKAEELLSAALKSVGRANGSAFHLRASSAVFSKQAPAVGQAFAKDGRAKFRLQHRPLGKGDAKADLKLLHDWVKDGLGGPRAAPAQADIKAKAGALILANALSFKGLWEREFTEATNDRRTFLGKKYTKIVMMHRAGLYRHLEDMENMVQVLEAPLWGGGASMVLLLPFHVEDLARLDKLLTPEQLSQWLEKMDVTSVSVSLPTANVTMAYNLQKALLALGLTHAWDQKVADFTGVSDQGKGKLHLGGALHWASLELAGQAGKGDAQLEEDNVEKPKLFYADHPFIIFIRDNATGALLLMGALDHMEGEALHDEL